MDIVKIAFEDLFLDFEKKLSDKKIILKYYRSFKGYNANVKYSYNFMEFHLSYEWKNISSEIQIGLIQSLISKIYKIKKNTYYLELYDLFLKNVHVSVSKDIKDEILLESFNRVNENYFNGLLEECNLVFGRESIRKLGSYDYTTDTISISSIFKKIIPQKNYLMDYVMYHEMLHKKLKFSSSSGEERKIKRHHTKEFRELEAKYENAKECEKELSRIGSFIKLKRAIIPKKRKGFLNKFF